MQLTIKVVQGEVVEVKRPEINGGVQVLEEGQDYTVEYFNDELAEEGKQQGRTSVTPSKEDRESAKKKPTH